MILRNINEITKYVIPGWTSARQCNVLTDTIASLPENARILEIGAAFGRTSWSILDGMKPGQTLDVCDTWVHEHFLDVFSEDPSTFVPRVITQGDVETIMWIKDVLSQKNPRQLWDELINRHPNRNLLREVMQIPSEELTNTDYDFVYLDGNHTYETVLHELLKFKHVPILFGDDYGDHQPGVVQAVKEFAAMTNKKLTVIPNEDVYFILTDD